MAFSITPKRSRSIYRALSKVSCRSSLASPGHTPLIVQHSSSKRQFTSLDATTSNRPGRADPTTKRPTQKCDPYGLSGQSLSYQECCNQLLTLDEGWKLTDTNHSITLVTPAFLEKQFYHETFYTASRFLSQISLLCTNLNHFPQLSMERVLVDDVTKYYNTEMAADVSDVSKNRKIKGWVFVSTIRCSTYRPPTKKEDTDATNTDKGLTYHDFHLAMSIDIEANREELGQLLLKVDE